MVHMTTTPDTASAAAGRAGVIITVAAESDLSDVLRVQREGFMRVAEKFDIDPDLMAPMTESLDDLVALHGAGVTTFIARSGDDAAGTVRATLRDDGVIEIGRLAVADGSVRRGVATALMLALEGSYPEASRFELYTGAEAVEPLALYARLGYRIFRREEYEAWSMVWLAKDRSRATAADDAPLHWSS